jgi:hypothetical protein
VLLYGQHIVTKEAKASQNVKNIYRKDAQQTQKKRLFVIFVPSCG